MSSAVFTLIGFYGAFHNASNSWYVWASLVAAIAMFFVASFLAWSDEYKAKRKAEASADLVAPRVILDYHWRNMVPPRNFPEPFDKPVVLRNEGEQEAVNVTIENIIMRDLVCEFDSVPHLFKGEPKELKASVSWNGVEIDNSALAHVLTGSANMPSRATPINVLYRNMRGDDFISQYDFKWDQDKGEGTAVLRFYGRIGSSAPKMPGRIRGFLGRLLWKRKPHI
jgi:hypothetical protein